MLFAVSAHAVELGSASNDQLIDELRYRLNAGSPGGSSAFADYSCSGQYLYISLTGPDGSTKQQNYYTSSEGACTQQIGTLNAKKSKINTTTIAALCAGQYLYRIPLLPAGTFGNVTNQYMSSENACTEQAKLINGN
jgi:hypothetical protein